MVCVFTTDYASGGSLYDYLSSAESEEMDQEQVMTWAMEIAKGTVMIHCLSSFKTCKGTCSCRIFCKAI